MENQIPSWVTWFIVGAVLFTVIGAVVIVATKYFWVDKPYRDKLKSWEKEEHVKLMTLLHQAESKLKDK